MLCHVSYCLSARSANGHKSRVTLLATAFGPSYQGDTGAAPLLDQQAAEAAQAPVSQVLAGHSAQ